MGDVKKKKTWCVLKGGGGVGCSWLWPWGGFDRVSAATYLCTSMSRVSEDFLLVFPL